MQIHTIEQVADHIREQNDCLILCHAHPDGDTLGSAYALCRALLKNGQRARVQCADPIPKKYDYLSAGLTPPHFSPQYIIAVDVADPKLLGSLKDTYGDRIDLSIDHHVGSRLFAKATFTGAAAANTEHIYALLHCMGTPIDAAIADCIYTGITTDTGCFRYPSTTAATHQIAAEMILRGANAARINQIMFETKSRAYLKLEQTALSSMRFYFNGKCAVVTLTTDDFLSSGANPNDVEGIAAIPRQIEGVQAGATIRQREDGAYKISLRTNAPLDAAKICAKMGGGGHARAAGCESNAPLDVTTDTLLGHIQTALEA